MGCCFFCVFPRNQMKRVMQGTPVMYLTGRAVLQRVALYAYRVVQAQSFVEKPVVRWDRAPAFLFAIELSEQACTFESNLNITF